MQIKVSSAIAKRMDDNNSIAARHARGPEFNAKPWVVTVIATETAKKKAGHLMDGPAYLGDASGIGSTEPLHTIRTSFTAIRRCNLPLP